jgi:hypothetical protein
LGFSWWLSQVHHCCFYSPSLMNTPPYCSLEWGHFISPKVSKKSLYFSILKLYLESPLERSYMQWATNLNLCEWMSIVCESFQDLILGGKLANNYWALPVQSCMNHIFINNMKDSCLFPKNRVNCTVEVRSHQFVVLDYIASKFFTLLLSRV